MRRVVPSVNYGTPHGRSAMSKSLRDHGRKDFRFLVVTQILSETPWLNRFSDALWDAPIKRISDAIDQQVFEKLSAELKNKGVIW